MTFNATMVLWFIMLVLVVQLTPAPKWAWGKLLLWACLTLVTVVLVLLKALAFKCQ